MTGILWLASYPKSGNTWLRAFLANYLRDGDAPVSINELFHFNFGDDILLYYTWMTGRPAESFSNAEIWRLRPAVHRYLASLTRETTLIKTHNVIGALDDGTPIITPDVTDGAIYVVRDPLDVAVSVAHHYQTSYDEAVDRMCTANNTLPGVPGEKLPSMIGSWRQNVESWLQAPGLKRHVMRYEDMLAKPGPTFRELVTFLGMPVDGRRVAKAVRFSRFDTLTSQEQEQGFNEARPDEAASFFRRGEHGQWREILTRDQVDRIVEANRDVMARFGYLDKKGRPV